MGADHKSCVGCWLGEGVVLVSTFNGPVEATTARKTLRATLDDLAGEVRELFSTQGGIVDCEQIAKIYARAGLHNDVGWQQDKPLTVKGAELIWELPEGAHAEDAENLLVSLGAISVVAHLTSADDEDWRSAPAPFPIPDGFLEDEYEGAEPDEDYATQNVPKRTLH